MNQLLFGGNLDVLRDHIATDSVDFIYPAPPFNSKRDYNLLFKSLVASGLRPEGSRATGSTLHSQVQITTFEDSWPWGEQAEREFDELVHAPNPDVPEMMQALRRFPGENDVTAIRLFQFHRVAITYEAGADGKTSETLIQKIIDERPVL